MSPFFTFGLNLKYTLMKPRLFMLIALLSTTFFTAKAQNYLHNWSFSFGGSSGDDCEVIATDQANNTYFSGNFSGTVDFDPGAGVVELTSTNTFDRYIVKIDQLGNFVWATHFPVVALYDIAFDASGNLYISGSFENTVDFDPGPSIFNLTSASSFDAFLLKLDANGNFVNAIRFGSLSADQPFSVALDENENVFTTGVFANTVDFDPGVGLTELTSAGSLDAFLAKYTSDLALDWALQLGGTDSDGENADIYYDNGFIYATGVFRGTADIDPTAGVQNETSLGDRDIYMFKIDTSGVLSWTQNFGGVNSDSPRDIICDSGGNIIITGSFSGSTDFDPGVGVTTLSSVGFGSDNFVTKFNANGDHQWAVSFGSSTASDNTRTLLTDAQNNIYTVGWFSGNGDFDPGTGTTTLTSAGSSDAFMEVLDANGAFVDVYQFPGASFVAARSSSMDANGNIYIAGYLNGTMDADPGTNTSNLSSLGSSDPFVVQLGNCNDNVVDVVSACDSYVWIDGNTYTSSNSSAQFLLQNQAGCDSLITLDLTINTSTAANDVIQDCNPIVWIDGNTYNQSNNTATFTLTNQAGCDSIVTLSFTLLSDDVTDVQIACDSLTWIDGVTYTSDNNSASVTLTNSFGCDSVVTLDLTIINPLLTVSENNGILTADQGGFLYQWLNCDFNFIPIPSESNQSFQPSANGNYAVVLMQNGCTDTSECVLIDNIGLDAINANRFSIYPNPTKGIVSVELQHPEGGYSLEVSTIDGRVVFKKELLSVTNQVTLPKESGVYLFRIGNNLEQFTYPIVKTE